MNRGDESMSGGHKDLFLYIGFAAHCLFDLPSFSQASVSLCVKLAQQYDLVIGDNTSLCGNAQLTVAVIITISCYQQNSTEVQTWNKLNMAECTCVPEVS